MSESSVTSSQLDDIELAEPNSKRYEHHTDVGYMFGEETPQWSLPVMPQRGSAHAQGASHLPDDSSSSSLAALDHRAGADALTQQRQSVASRLEHDSGAAPDSVRHATQAGHRLVEARPDAMEDSVARRAPAGSCTVTVDVLSPAFTLTEHTWQQGSMLGKSPADIICQRACTGLGVDRESLRYFELSEVPASQLQSSRHYAVSIDRSGASHFVHALNYHIMMLRRVRSRL